MPSTRSRQHPHPLRQILLRFARADREIVLRASPDIIDPRAFEPSNFYVEADQSISDSVVLVDDSWVSGGHAQAAAGALKLAGVRYVANFNVARVLDHKVPTTEQYMTRHPRSFVATRCPWTGTECGTVRRTVCEGPA